VEATEELEVESLRQRFDELFESGAWLNPHPRPTDGSLLRIERHFGIRLPRVLVTMARSSKAAWCFLSLGPDYDSHQHIIRVNSYWRQRRRTRRLPQDLVLLTHGHDDYYWALDVARVPGGDALPMQFWCPDKITYCSDERPTQRYPSFLEWLRAEVHWGEFHAHNGKRKP
jgi:hypothetical protein